MKKFLLFIISFSSSVAFADITTVNFLIPGGKNSGWDTTAQKASEALIETGLIKESTFQYISGGGGGRALIDIIRNEQHHSNTLMVQSTPLILRNLTGVIKNSYKDIQPVSLMIAEYQVIAVPYDSMLMSIQDLVKAVKDNPVKARIIGGSPKGSLDHITIASLFKAAGMQPNHIRYIPSDGGGEALERLYKKYGVALVTGYGEIISEVKKNNLRILGISNDTRLPHLDSPTFKEEGYEVVFVNWRGFFAGPNIGSKQLLQYEKALKTLSQSEEWKQIRAEFGWEDFYKSGDELQRFLENQENDIKTILNDLAL